MDVTARPPLRSHLLRLAVIMSGMKIMIQEPMEAIFVLID
jgi:hypothetical protein